MKSGRFGVLVVVAGLLLTALPALAHHSFTAEFDFKKPITLTGTIVQFEFINPHGRITMEVKNDDGTTTRWLFEVSNPNGLLRLGWRKDSLKPGDTVTIDAYLAKDGSHFANASRVLLPDGRRVFAGSAAPNQDVK